MSNERLKIRSSSFKYSAETNCSLIFLLHYGASASHPLYFSSDTIFPPNLLMYD